MTSLSQLPIASLSKDVFERRSSIGSEFFSFLGNVFAKIFGQIVCIRVKKHGKTNVVASRHIKRQKVLLPVELRRSKTPFLKLSNVILHRGFKLVDKKKPILLPETWKNQDSI